VVAHDPDGGLGVAAGDRLPERGVSLAGCVGHVRLAGVQRVEGLVDEGAGGDEHGVESRVVR